MYNFTNFFCIDDVTFALNSISSISLVTCITHSSNDHIRNIQTLCGGSNKLLVEYSSGDIRLLNWQGIEQTNSIHLKTIYIQSGVQYNDHHIPSVIELHTLPQMENGESFPNRIIPFSAAVLEDGSLFLFHKRFQKQSVCSNRLVCLLQSETFTCGCILEMKYLFKLAKELRFCCLHIGYIPILVDFNLVKLVFFKLHDVDAKVVHKTVYIHITYTMP